MQRLLAMFLQDQQADRAVSLMYSLRLIINCALVPSLDGQRIQLREFLAFGPAERDLFLGTPVANWSRLTTQLLVERGQDYAAATARAFAAGLISDEVASCWMESA